MELIIAGGVGEHGRNCFLVQGETIRFLVDCGIMADTPEDPYPRLTREQIGRLDAVFLTHSHADHTGALPWLYENGFQGTVIATEETMRQLPFPVQNSLALEEICPGGTGRLQSLFIQWGRSGHCVGSVWYYFTESGKTILFSGDYTEDTQVYVCDPIRNRQADFAVLDCAYGLDETSYGAACDQLVQKTEALLSDHKLLLFPVPKYGRGLEILKLFSERLPGVSYSADALFLQNLAEQDVGGFWYRPKKTSVPVRPYNGQTQGIVWISDPQLRSKAAQGVAEQVLLLGGMAVMTGTLEKGSYSENLFRQGKMALLRYPVHLNHVQLKRLEEKNGFRQTLPYHSKKFSAKRDKDRNEVTNMTYKTIVIDYAPKAKKMAAAIEEKANELVQAGWELVTFSVTNSAKAILVFRATDDVRQEETAQEETAPLEETVEAVGEAE